MEKVFWQSKVFWTQVIGSTVTILSAVIPSEYKEILTASSVLLTAVLTVVFRWNTEQPLGFKK